MALEPARPYPPLPHVLVASVGEVVSAATWGNGHSLKPPRLSEPRLPRFKPLEGSENVGTCAHPWKPYNIKMLAWLFKFNAIIQCYTGLYIVTYLIIFGLYEIQTRRSCQVASAGPSGSSLKGGVTLPSSSNGGVTLPSSSLGKGGVTWQEHLNRQTGSFS